MCLTIWEGSRYMPVSLIKRKQIELSNNLIVQEYILPGFSSNRQERIKKPDDIVSDTDQILIMDNK